MPDPDPSRLVSAASPAPPDGLFWTFWEFVGYVDLRDPKSVRDAPFTDHLSPRLRQAIARAREALRNRTVRVFEFKDIDGVVEFREVSLQRWSRPDPTNAVIEGFAIQMNDLDGFVGRLDILYGGILIPADDAMAAFPASAKTDAPAPAAPAPAAPAPAQSAAESGRRGGKKSGKVRRANRPWVPHAKELALNIDPDLSNEALATKIDGDWKRRDVDPPSVRTLAGFVAELRTAGKLPQRKTRSRS